MIQIDPWLLVTVLIVYGFVFALAIKFKSGRKVWKIAFWLSLLLPIVVFISAYVSMTSGASSYPDPTRTEIQVGVFFYAVIIGITVSILCLPIWIILGIRAFRKQAGSKGKDVRIEKDG